MNCPCCGKELEVISEKPGVFSVWCPWGKCPSMIMNDGADGSTPEEAFDKLEALWEVERDA